MNVARTLAERGLEAGAQDVPGGGNQGGEWSPLGTWTRVSGRGWAVRLGWRRSPEPIREVLEKVRRIRKRCWLWPAAQGKLVAPQGPKATRALDSDTIGIPISQADVESAREYLVLAAEVDCKLKEQFLDPWPRRTRGDGPQPP